MLEPCPTCGAQVLFTSAMCPNCQTDRNKPDPAKAAQWKARRAASSAKKSFIVDDLTPLQQEYLRGEIARAPLRRCTCDGRMMAHQARGSFLFGLLPTGSNTFTYLCERCHQSRTIASQVDLLSTALAAVGFGCFALAGLGAFILSADDRSRGTVAVVLVFGLLAAFYVRSFVRDRRAIREFPEQK
jgi:hypothetical protein